MKVLPFPDALAPDLTSNPWRVRRRGIKGEELGQGPSPLPAISPALSLPIFASGFLFLSNKQKITIWNWAGGVWEGGLQSTGDSDGGLPGVRTGEREQFGEKLDI